MSEIYGQVKQAGKYIDHLIKLPVRCWVFIVGIFLYFQPNVVKAINISGWFPQEIRNVVEVLFELLFDNIIFICAALLAIGIIIIFFHTLISHLPEGIYKSFFPDDVEYTDGTIESLNSYTAANRIWQLLFEMLTTIWSWYFLFIIIFENKELLAFSSQYSSYFIILWINIFYLLWSVRNSLFIIKLPQDELYIEGDKKIRYIEIAFFEYEGRMDYGFQNEKMKISFLKNKYNNKYYLGKMQLTNTGQESKNFQSKLPVNKLEYKIINSSENFEEIRYHYENRYNIAMKEEKVL